MNELERAAVAAAEHGAPPKVWHVGPDAEVILPNGPVISDGLQLTAWDAADVASGRSE